MLVIQLFNNYWMNERMPEWNWDKYKENGSEEKWKKEERSTERNIERVLEVMLKLY